MLKVLQHAMGDIVVSLSSCFLLHAIYNIVESFSCSIQVLHSYWLLFDSVTTMIASAFAADSLRKLGKALHHAWKSQ